MQPQKWKIAACRNVLLQGCFVFGEMQFQCLFSVGIVGDA